MKQSACTMKSILPMNPLSKQVRVIDGFGDPIDGVHVITDNGRYNTITDQNGMANVQHHGYENITFSHVGKETKVIRVTNIQSEVILEDSIQELDAVVINAKPKTSNASLWLLIPIVVGTIYAFTSKQPKKVNL